MVHYLRWWYRNDAQVQALHLAVIVQIQAKMEVMLALAGEERTVGGASIFACMVFFCSAEA